MSVREAVVVKHHLFCCKSGTKLTWHAVKLHNVAVKFDGKKKKTSLIHKFLHVREQTEIHFTHPLSHLAYSCRGQELMGKMRSIGMDGVGRCGEEAGLTFEKTRWDGLEARWRDGGIHRLHLPQPQETRRRGTKMLTGIKQSKASRSCMCLQRIALNRTGFRRRHYHRIPNLHWQVK